MSTVLPKTRVIQNLGQISTSGAGTSTSYVTFGIPDISGVFRGRLTLTAAGGGVSGATWGLSCSIDNGNTWFTIDPDTANSISGGGGAGGGTSVTYVSQYDISGLAGSLFTFGLVYGTVSNPMTIWALVG